MSKPYDPYSWSDFTELIESTGHERLQSGPRLPVNMSENDRKALESAGLSFLDQDKDFPVLQKVALPNGWYIQPDDVIDTVSYLVDDLGRKRAHIVYKASPIKQYDQARLGLLSKFRIGEDRDLYKTQHKIRYQVIEAGKGVIFETDVYNDFEFNTSSPEERDQYMHYVTDIQRLAETWLDGNYPLWRDSLSYWGYNIG